MAIPGNHDRRALVRETFPDPTYGMADNALNTVRRIGGLDIFLIDSTVTGAAHGELDAPRLTWLDGTLGARPHDLPSSFCIIDRLTRGLCTQTPRGYETPTHLPLFLDDTRARC